MNGFEPLRRRVTDYTVAGQWQEVYDGPIEECEEYRFKAKNEELRELVRDMWGWFTTGVVVGVTLYDLAGRMRELGIEVDG